jgi:hypothetical protein
MSPTFAGMKRPSNSLGPSHPASIRQQQKTVGGPGVSGLTSCRIFASAKYARQPTRGDGTTVPTPNTPQPTTGVKVEHAPIHNPDFKSASYAANTLRQRPPNSQPLHPAQHATPGRRVRAPDPRPPSALAPQSHWRTLCPRTPGCLKCHEN